MTNFREWFDIQDTLRQLLKSKQIPENAKLTNVNSTTLSRPFASSDIGSGRDVGQSKPTGNFIWYGCGTSWLEFIMAEKFHIARYIHEVEIDMSKMLVVTSKQDLDKRVLNCQPGEKPLRISKYDFFPDAEKNKCREYPDWLDLSKKYTGIDFCSWFDREGFLYSWDVPQGVVWNGSAIKSSKLLFDLQEIKEPEPEIKPEEPETPELESPYVDEDVSKLSPKEKAEHDSFVARYPMSGEGSHYWFSVKNDEWWEKNKRRNYDEDY